MKNKNQFILNLTSLKNNALTIKNNLANHAKLCAMVKANAYGHGLKYVYKALVQIADFFGVASFEEAKQIRRFDKLTPILIVGLVCKADYVWCSENNVSVTIDTLDKIKELQKLTFKNKLHIHLKINTGMNRFGFSKLDEFKEAYFLISNLTNVLLEGIFTHFATSNEDENFIIEQNNRFQTYLKEVNTKNIIIHACNSYATNHFPNMHYNMVRVGFDLYGYTLRKDLAPVLEIKSKIVAFQEVNSGDSVGYERKFVANNKMKIAIVSLGYGDGFDRRCSSNTSVIVNSSVCNIVGFVCMDAFMIDVTHLEKVQLNDEVLILGLHSTLNLTPQYYAKMLNTSPYEILLKWHTKRMNIVLK